MHIRAPAIVCASRPHGQTAVIARLLTAHGLEVAGERVPNDHSAMTKDHSLPPLD